MQIFYNLILNSQNLKNSEIKIIKFKILSSLKINKI